MSNYLNQSYWYKKEARKIYGTDGQLFPPGISNSQKLNIFVGQICRYLKQILFIFFRSIELEKVGTEVVDGIPTNIYHPSKSMNDIDLQKKLGFCNPNSPIFFKDTYVQESRFYL